MRVLIAEDDAASSLILRTAVERLGHTSLAADDGVKAWEILQATAVDVVISDWMMPGLTGIELCRRVRSDPRPGYTYFIFLTSQSEKTQMLSGIESGADDYLLKPLDFDELKLRLLVAARITGLHAELGDKRRELERLNQRLSEEGRTDSLTQLGNRLRLNEDLEVLAARARRHGQRYCIAMCDIDFFKIYNDTHGHGAGDEVLRTVARAIRDTARQGDGLYRYGGEEFVLVLPEQSLATAALAVDRMRKAVESLAIPLDQGPPARIVTISAGVAVLTPGEGGNSEHLLTDADAALYRAKKLGRNNVQVAE